MAAKYEPSDQMGSLTDRPWVGIWPKAKGGTIVCVDNQGVQLFRYKNDKKLWEAWSTFEQSVDKATPDQGDIAITENGYFNVSLVEEGGDLDILQAGIGTIWQARQWIKMNADIEDDAKVWLADGDKWLLLDMTLQDPESGI